MVFRSLVGRSFRYLAAPRAALLSGPTSNVNSQIPRYRTIGSEAYEGDGKTTMKSLNESQDGQRLLVNSYSTMGFRLTNQMFALGSIALFPCSLFQWNIEKPEEVSAESLSLFLKLEPKLDILVIGYGERGEVNKIDRGIYQLCLRHRISLELLPTHQACATFNFLNSELRSVAAGLLPPLHTTSNDETYHNPSIARRAFLLQEMNSDSEADRKAFEQYQADGKRLLARKFDKVKKNLPDK